MICKTAVVMCLLLALAMVVCGAISYHGEIVCWGRAVWTGPSGLQLSPLAPGNAVTGSRASLVNGSFVHLWTSAPRQFSSERSTDGIVIRRRRNCYLLRAFAHGDLLPGKGVNYTTVVTDRVLIPLWVPLVLLLIYPAVTCIPTAFLWWRDRRRIPPGHCQKCGYDLTGNVSGVCPECGEKVGG